MRLPVIVRRKDRLRGGEVMTREGVGTASMNGRGMWGLYHDRSAYDPRTCHAVIMTLQLRGDTVKVGILK